MSKQIPADEIVGVRLFTRAPITLPWLARSIVPVARGLHQDGQPGVRLRRGWLHGAHVDVLARAARGRAPAWGDIAAGLDAGPLDPDRAVGEETYLDQAREFGRLEAVPPPYLPMAGHGAVELLGPDDVAFRDAGMAGLSELDLVDSVLTVPLLSAIDELAGRPALAPARLAEAFAAVADAHFLGLAYGVFSFRSHAEAFLAWAAPSRDLRPVFAARLAGEAAALRPVVEQRLSGEVSGAAAAWRTAAAYSAGTLDSAVSAGRLTLDMLDAVSAGTDRTGMGPPSAPAVVPRGAQPDTDFHQAMAGVIADPDRWFAGYRALINVFYRKLPLLTVSPLQRYYTCYAVAELVDEVLGESWRQRLDRPRVRVPDRPAELQPVGGRS
jgi:hypothetical protein